MARELTDRAPHAAPRDRMSYEEFRAWATEEIRAEWVDGEVITLVPPDERHQSILSFLHVLLRLVVSRQKCGRVYLAPFEMRLGSGRSYREPDLLYVNHNHVERVTRTRLDGPADIVFEIVSADSATRDYREKFREYAASGVAEYWIVDPRIGRNSVKAYYLTGQGVYEEIPPGVGGRITSSELTGFLIDPTWLLADPLPDPFEIIAEHYPAT